LLIDSRRIRKEGEMGRGGVLPELTDLVGDGSFEKGGSGWDTVVTGGTRLGNALRSSWERLQEHAKVNTTGDYEGLLVEPATAGAVNRQLQSALTKEVELVKHDKLIGTALYELKGIRSDRSHSNYNGAQVTGVEKREIQIPIEIQKQAVDLDEKMFGVTAPAVGPWQRQLNELGGVKPLAFGQYGELGPGFEQLLDQLAEKGANEAAKRYLIPNHVVAKGVQLRLLRQRVVMTAQKAQADVLLHRLHYALPGWDAAPERRNA
jgi:hypothetical protein